MKLKKSKGNMMKKWKRCKQKQKNSKRNCQFLNIHIQHCNLPFKKYKNKIIICSKASQNKIKKWKANKMKLRKRKRNCQFWNSHFQLCSLLIIHYKHLTNNSKNKIIISSNQSLHCKEKWKRSRKWLTNMKSKSKEWTNNEKKCRRY